MDALAVSIVSDPLWYIGLLFSFLGALAFLTFLRGLLAGVPHFFTLSSHEEHIEHHRVRITWGFWAMVFLFILWQILRAIGNLFTI